MPSREDSYFENSGDKYEDQSYLSYFYSRDENNFIDIPLPKGVTGIDRDGMETTKSPSPRRATQSIFNRYSLFYYNSMSLGRDAEGYLDKPNRLEDAMTPHKAHFKKRDPIVDPKTGEVLFSGSEKYCLKKKTAETEVRPIPSFATAMFEHRLRMC